MQRCRRMGLHKGVAYEYTIFVSDENLFFGEYDASYAVGGARNALAVKFADVFVAVGAVYSAFVAMNSEIERCSVLYHRLVKRRQEYMRTVAHLGYGYHQKSVLLTGIAPYKRGAMVCSGTIGAQHLLR